MFYHLVQIHEEKKIDSDKLSRMLQTIHRATKKFTGCATADETLFLIQIKVILEMHEKITQKCATPKDIASVLNHCFSELREEK